MSDPVKIDFEKMDGLVPSASIAGRAHLAKC